MKILQDQMMVATTSRNHSDLYEVTTNKKHIPVSTTCT